MAKMGSRKHLKTYKAPKTWPIHPKEDTWTVKPSAGSHSIENSLSLTLVIRDILKLADNSREAKRIIDFLSGVIYAIGGSMQKIGVGIYLCTPKNVNVQGKISDESEKVSKNNTDEELDW